MGIFEKLIKSLNESEEDIYIDPSNEEFFHFIIKDCKDRGGTILGLFARGHWYFWNSLDKVDLEKVAKMAGIVNKPLEVIGGVVSISPNNHLLENVVYQRISKYITLTGSMLSMTDVDALVEIFKKTVTSLNIKYKTYIGSIVSAILRERRDRKEMELDNPGATYATPSFREESPKEKKPPKPKEKKPPKPKEKKPVDPNAPSYQSNYYYRNREEILKKRNYRYHNNELSREGQKKRYLNHLEAKRAYRKAYYQNNLEYFKQWFKAHYIPKGPKYPSIDGVPDFNSMYYSFDPDKNPGIVDAWLEYQNELGNGDFDGQF